MVKREKQAMVEIRKKHILKERLETVNNRMVGNIEMQEDVDRR